MHLPGIQCRFEIITKYTVLEGLGLVLVPAVMRNAASVHASEITAKRLGFRLKGLGLAIS